MPFEGLIKPPAKPEIMTYDTFSALKHQLRSQFYTGGKGDPLVLGKQALNRSNTVALFKKSEKSEKPNTTVRQPPMAIFRAERAAEPSVYRVLIDQWGSQSWRSLFFLLLFTFSSFAIDQTHDFPRWGQNRILSEKCAWFVTISSPDYIIGIQKTKDPIREL